MMSTCVYSSAVQKHCQIRLFEWESLGAFFAVKKFSKKVKFRRFSIVCTVWFDVSRDDLLFFFKKKGDVLVLFLDYKISVIKTCPWKPRGTPNFHRHQAHISSESENKCA